MSLRVSVVIPARNAAATIGAAVATSTKRRSPAGSPGSHARALIDVPPDAPVGGRSGPLDAPCSGAVPWCS